jgi:hypothetical protein
MFKIMKKNQMKKTDQKTHPHLLNYQNLFEHFVLFLRQFSYPPHRLFVSLHSLLIGDISIIAFRVFFVLLGLGGIFGDRIGDISIIDRRVCCVLLGRRLAPGCCALVWERVCGRRGLCSGIDLDPELDPEEVV